MIKKYITTVLLVLICTLFVNCGGSENDNLEPPKPDPNTKITIFVSQTTLSIPAEGGEQTFTVETNAKNWTVSASEKWLTINQDGLKVLVKAEANMGAKHTAIIECKVENETVKANVTVIQEQLSSRHKEKMALTDLSKALNLNWDLEDDISNWEGVEVNDNGEVVILDIASKQLTGKLTSSIGQLTKLQYLDISENEIEGNLPPEIEELTELGYLDVSSNRLTGTSLSLKASTKLIIADFSFNDFSSIPAVSTTNSNLEYLALSSNNLSGNLPINLSSHTKLVYLDLSMNKFTGSIPNEWNKLEKLRALHLYKNALSGTIPDYICQLNNLQSLALNHNDLEGAIPAELGQLAKLDELYLMQNKLTGSIPNSLINNPRWRTWEQYVWSQQEGFGFTNNFRSLPSSLSKKTALTLTSKYYKSLYRR